MGSGTFERKYLNVIRTLWGLNILKIILYSDSGLNKDLDQGRRDRRKERDKVREGVWLADV